MSVTFKGEAWTLRVAPTHKVMGALSGKMEELGFFHAEEMEEVSLMIDIFRKEYPGHTIMAVGFDFDNEATKVA